MSYKEIADEHTKKINDLIDGLFERVRSVQSEFYDNLYDDIVKSLTENGKIKRGNVGSLSAFPAYRKASGRLLNWIIEAINELSESIAKYFGFVTKRNVSEDVRKATETLLNQLGYNGKKFSESGVLYSLVSDSSVERRVKVAAIQAINTGKSLKDFRVQLQAMILGDRATGKFGIVEAHYHTNARTLFSEFDRSVSYNIAAKYDLNYVVWSGPRLTSSRSFCASKKGKVFPVSEIKGFDKKDWQGKIPGQSTIISAGGYNCTDNLLYITKEMAEEMII